MNEASLETDLNSTYAQLGASNAFTQPITFANSQTFPGTVATSTANTFTATQSLGATAAATSSSGASSNPLLFSASDWDTGVEGPQAASFQWQAEPVGSNTGSPSGSMNLLFGYGSATPVETGLSIAGNGIINFASGQSFPGSLTTGGNNTFTGNDTFSNPITFASGQTFPGTLASLTANGPITASTSTGAVTVGLDTSSLESTLNGVYAQLGASNTFTSPITFASSQTFPGTLSGAYGGTDITASVSNGILNVALNTSSLETSLDARYPQLSAANTFTQPITFANSQTFPGTVSASANTTFTGTETFSNPITFASSQTFPNTVSSITAGTDISTSTSGSTTTVGVNTSALESTLNSVYPQLSAANTFSGTNAFNSAAALGASFSAYNTAAYFTSTDTSSSTISATLWVVSPSTDSASVGILGNSEYAGASIAGKFGLHGTSSEGSTAIADYGGVGVWGDAGSQTTSQPGLLATADNAVAAVVANNSSSGTVTLYVLNDGNSSGNVFSAHNSKTNTTCNIDAHANLACSGTLSSVVRANDRQLTSFSVQSSENWLEDYGSAQLVNGTVHVQIDPTFAATINSNVDYHVFLTPNGDSHGLYIASKRADGFDVRESGGGHATIAFDYRIVAHPRGHETERLTDVTAAQQEAAAHAGPLRNASAQVASAR